jgi:phosphotransferase system HPr-like phosphotransfer protein
MRTDKICSALAQLLSLDSEIVANPQEVDLEIFDGALPLTPAQQDEVVGRMVAAMQENKYIQEERDWGREFNRAARSREEGSDRVCDFAKQKMDAASQQAGELRRRLAERMLLWPAAAAKVLPQMMAQERGTLNSTAARVAFIDLLVKAALGQMPAERTPIEAYLREIVEAAAPDHDPGATTYQARFFGVEVYKAAKAGLQKLGVAFSTQGQVKESTTAGDHSHPNVARWIQDSFVKYFPQTTAVIKKMVEGQPPREASADSMTEIIGLAYKEGDPLSVEASGEDAKLAAKWLVAALSARREDTQPLWAEK